MNKSKITFAGIAFLIVCLLSLTNVFAQTESPQPVQIDPSYEVTLHILTGSNDSNNKSPIPQTLSNVVKKLKNTYSFSNYQLNVTYLERMSVAGNLEFKSVSRETIQNQETSASVFSEWTLNDLRSASDRQGKNILRFQSFRFGQRVPVITSTFKDESGKSSNIINYEQIGLTMQKFALPENVPTIVGSLSTSKPGELLFLVLTVKPAD